MRFNQSIKTTDSGGRKTGMTKRQIVLELMRLAGYGGDRGRFTQLLSENPISMAAANEAWARGAAQRR